MNINYADSCNFKPIPAITPLDGYWQNSTWKFNMPEITVSTGTTPSWQDIILSGNTALTLTNALADGLNYLKLFGGTEQRNLPSGYTQVEYLESSGSQYIDTGIFPNNVNNVKANISFSTLGTLNYILGTRFSGGVALGYILYSSAHQGITMYPGAWPEQGKSDTVINKVYNINASVGSLSTLQVDGVEVVSYNTPTLQSGDKSFYIFALHGNGAEYFASARLYSMLLYNDNELVASYIPCKRNSDNVLGMYDTVSQTFFTNAGTGDFTAGADVTPTPDTPMDIVCNNGAVKVSPNLFDNSTLYNWFFTNGALTYKDGRYAKYMRISSSETYTISRNDNYDVPLKIVQTEITPDDGVNYNIDGTTTYVQIESNQFPFTFTSRGSAKFLAFSADASLTEAQSIDLFNKLQVEQGSTATTYKPYGQIYTDGITETVEITGKNLFDYEYFYDNYQMYSPSSVGRCPIKLQPNTTYTVSTNEEASSSSSKIFVVSGSAINWTPLSNENGVFVNKPRTVTTDSNGYLCLGLYVAGVNAIPKSNFENGNVWIQIEQGSSATPYEPYFNGGTASAEMLLKVGTYQDVHSVLDGGVTRNVGIKVLDGTEDWKASYQGFFEAPLLNHITSAPAYCNYFQTVTTGIVPPVAERTNKVWLGSTWVGLGATTKFSTVAQFKTWLATQYANGTPVIIVYPLATATTETVTGQPLTTQAGTNIVSITQASIDNLELEVSFKQSTI